VRRLIIGTQVVGLALLASCADESNAERGPATATAASATRLTLVSPAVFEQRVATTGVITINVHVPNDGSIEGTDLTIPFDDVSTTKALSSDRSTPLAVYCRSGDMSADAVRDLAALGYTDIVELSGGFNAWKESGRALRVP